MEAPLETPEYQRPHQNAHLQRVCPLSPPLRLGDLASVGNTRQRIGRLRQSRPAPRSWHPLARSHHERGGPSSLSPTAPPTCLGAAPPTMARPCPAHARGPPNANHPGVQPRNGELDKTTRTTQDPMAGRRHGGPAALQRIIRAGTEAGPGPYRLATPGIQCGLNASQA